MQLSNLPARILAAFAVSGAKRTIPVASQIGVTPGAASYTDGFPPLTMLALNAGGVPPAGQDFNGIFNAITLIQQWQSAGGSFAYDAAWSTANNGYPKGACIARADGTGFWFNTTDNNTADPDGATPTGWVPEWQYGITAITGLTNANVTLTSVQYGRPIITLAGTLTGNVQIILPALAGLQRLIVNNTTGAFTVTAKTAAGTGAGIPNAGGAVPVWGDGTNIYGVLATGRLSQIQTFTASGTYTPTLGTRSIIVEAIGGGGAGGGAAASAAGENRCGSGGAGGSYAKVYAAVPASPAAVTIGASGIAVTGGVGGAGGTTSLAGIVSCPGGGGGQSAATVTTGFSQAPQSAPGAAPTISTGSTLVSASGQPGLLGWLNSGIVGSGQGAPSQFGGGGPNTNSGNGGVSNAKGAGGGGGASAPSTGPFPGGNGGPGVIIIMEFA